MRLVLDIECNALENPSQIWVICAYDLVSKQSYTFYPYKDGGEKFNAFVRQTSLVIGHNLLGYDYPILNKLIGFTIPIENCCDTLILSKLIDYPRAGHSVESYGEEFGIPKGDFSDWSKYSIEMEGYCRRDVEITARIFQKYEKYYNKPEHKPSILLEHQFQLIVNQLHENGFAFNVDKASKLLNKVEGELNDLDKDILSAFKPKLKLIREVTPKATKHGTISLSSIPKVLRDSIHDYNIDAPFSYCKWVSFNPSSHKQIIEVLNEAGWRPTDKTKTYIDKEREYNLIKKKRDNSLDIRKKELYDDLNKLRKTGWKVNEVNLETLPPTSPAPARLLAKRILLEARRRTLTEWLSLTHHTIEIDQTGINGTEINGILIPFGEKSKERKTDVGVQPTLKNPEQATANHISNISTDCHSKRLIEWLKRNKVNAQFVKETSSSTLITVIGQDQLENFSAAIATVPSVGTKSIHPKYKVISSRIHGRFNGLGAWSHRMNHQNPNTANIPNELDTFGKKKLYGKELRSFWMAPPKRLLVGVDAEGIQLRIFAHYIDDPEFTQSLINGKKEDKSDPHSLNASILGPVCKSRAAAKRFIYAMLLGAGLDKLAEILGCSRVEAEEALKRIMDRYEGFRILKETRLPADGRRGYFTGLDGRLVRIPGDTAGGRTHLSLSGYLQNGEAVVMKRATLKWHDKLKDYDAKLVNFVHDEWQTECPNDMGIALNIARLQSDSLREVGEDLQLKCPLAGSYWNDDTKDYTIDLNWSKTH